MPFGYPGTGGTVGDWVEYTHQQVIDEIDRRAGNPNLTPLQELSISAKTEFEDGKAEFTSILTALNQNLRDEVVEDALKRSNKLKIATQDQLLRAQMPSGEFHSRDQMALSQGIISPPHLAYQAGLVAFGLPTATCDKLSMLAERVANHLARKETTMQPGSAPSTVGGRVFIGHGGSRLWMELKIYIQDRLRLPCDDFNRESTAGVATSARLGTMLNSASFAFVVATAEDEQADGAMRARENVVHEAGLFQGKLGFTKAIVMLEDGCEEFTNIAGLGQIRFPKDAISACFHEVRDVLVREGLLVS
jgi:predicted nucleotide-binding protein